MSTIEDWRDPPEQDPSEQDDPECICADPNEPTPDCYHHGTEAMNERAAWLDEKKANDQ